MIGPLLDFRSDDGVSDACPGPKVVIQKLFEIIDVHFVFVLDVDQTERNLGFVLFTSGLQHFHVFDEVLKRNLGKAKHTDPSLSMSKELKRRSEKP